MRESQVKVQTFVELGDPVRRLVMPAELQNCEGLREVVYRACSINAFSRSKVVLDLAKCTSVQRLSALATCDSRDDLHSIAQVLGIDAIEGQLALAERPAPYASRDFVSFFGQSVRRVHISNTRRIAPLALARSATLKAVWSLKPLPLDPTSREWLLDRCPFCSANLGWEYACDPWYCDQCFADLRDGSNLVYEPADEKALDFVGRLLDPECRDRKIVVSAETGFSNENDGDLFQLAVRIAQTCQWVEQAGRDASIDPRYLERAGRAVLDWPESFLALIDETVVLPTEGVELGWFNRRPLRRLQFDPTLSVSIRKRIKALLDCARRIEGGVQSVAIFGEAGTHSGTLSEFVEQRAGDKVIRMTHPRSALLRLITQRGNNSVDHLTTSLHPDLTMAVVRDVDHVRRFSCYFGLPVPEIWKLYRSGLVPELGPAIAHLGCSPASKVEGSLEGHIAATVRSGMGKDALSLVSVRFAMDPSLEASWAAILQAILDGRLEVWRRENPRRGLLSNLFVNNFASLRSLIAEGSEGGEMRNALITQVEISMIIDRTRTVAADIVRAGFMSGVSTIGKFAELRRSWVFAFELKTLAAIAGRSITGVHRRLATSGIEQATSGGVSFWKRDEALSFLGLASA